jgi:adenylate cyclase
MSSFLSELKRRNVIRMAGLYLVGAWLVVQVAETLLPVYEAPAWVLKSLIGLLAIGFVPALVFAWIFELTPEGIMRDADVDSAHSITVHTARRMNRVLVALLVLALGYFAVDKYLLAPQRRAEVAAPANSAGAAPESVSELASIAVLPFVDMSQNHDQEYFSDGLSEELLNLLAQLPQLRVIARTSSFSFKGKEVDVATIAKTLNVGYLLEGSVRKSGDTIRITAQLVRASDSSHAWSQTYDRQLTDVFKVQYEIAAAIVGTLQARLGGTPAPVAPARQAVPAAYDAYLQGRAFVAGRFDNLDKAIQAFDRAIAIDPGYSAAYSGKAFAILLKPLWVQDTPSRAVLDEARRWANVALQLDPGNAEAHMVRGTAASYGGDPLAAEADLDHALSLAPGNADILNFDGDFRQAFGDLGAAERDKRKAMVLDPLAFVHPMNLSDVLSSQGRFAESVIVAQQAIALGGRSFAYDRLFLAHLGAGQLDLAEQAMLGSCASSIGDPSGCRIDRLQLLAARGQRAEALAMLEPFSKKLAEGNYDSYSSPSGIALYYVYLQDIPKATAAQRLALDQSDWFLTSALYLAPGGAKLPEEISQDPQWLAVWDDPRMKAIADYYRRHLLAWRAQGPAP